MVYYLSVYSPNAGKYRPEKNQIRTLFTQWFLNATSQGHLYFPDFVPTARMTQLSSYILQEMLTNIKNVSSPLFHPPRIPFLQNTYNYLVLKVFIILVCL